jgi:cell division protein FtsQ
LTASTRQRLSSPDAVRLRGHRRPRGADRVGIHTARSAHVEEEPRLVIPRKFVVWLATRLLAFAILLGSAWVVYDFASSDRFQVQSVRVNGSVLLSHSDVESIASVLGANVFWVDPRQVEARLLAHPVVHRAKVSPKLLGTVQVNIVERQPAAFWVSGDQTFLVDREGIVLESLDENAAEGPRACAGQPCDPTLATTLPLVVQRDGVAPIPGDRVDTRTLVASARLAALLPPIGVYPLGFEWSRENGLEVLTQNGWRVWFDGTADLQRQVSALQSIHDHLAQTGLSAEIIDVRFPSRPYFR